MLEPFRNYVRVLLRLGNILIRGETSMSDLSSMSDGITLIVGPVIIIPTMRRVLIDAPGKELVSRLPLTRSEYLVLLCLGLRAETIVTKKEIMKSLARNEIQVQGENWIENLICKIRGKMNLIKHGYSGHLKTGRQGYKLSATQ
jgi:DNA-binding response OmpR family regulator